MKSIIKAILAAICLWWIAGTAHAQVAAISLSVSIPAINDSGNVYIAGSFNYWHGGDSLYRLTRKGDGLYTIVLPVFDGREYQYKYTLGNWDRVELAFAGGDRDNRKFVAVNGMQQIDTVILFRKPGKTEEKAKSPQQQKINAMKDSTVARLQPELAAMQTLLKSSLENLLQDNPSRKAFRKANKQAMGHIDKIFHGVADLLWQVFTSLQPEQKKSIREALHQQGGDMMNNLSKALDKAVQ